MRLLGLLALVVLGAAASDQAPAELRVAEAGRDLSYEVVNLSPYTITGFEVMTVFLSGGFENLGCAVSADVKTPKDLVIRNACGRPLGDDGKPVAYSSRLVEVRFENGLTWKPEEAAKPEKR